jgi:hypothetical protein
MRIRQAPAIAGTLADGHEFHRLEVALQLLQGQLDCALGTVPAHREPP